MIVDFRKQLDGLIVIIVDALDKDPSSGDLFIFRNRSGNKLKCVYFVSDTAITSCYLDAYITAKKNFRQLQINQKLNINSL